MHRACFFKQRLTCESGVRVTSVYCEFLNDIGNCFRKANWTVKMGKTTVDVLYPVVDCVLLYCEFLNDAVNRIDQMGLAMYSTSKGCDHGLVLLRVCDQQAFPLFLLLGSFARELQMMGYGPFR